MRFVFCASLPLLASCGLYFGSGHQGGQDGTADQIVLTSGNNQHAWFYTSLDAPLVVTVEDSVGQPVAGSVVEFVVTAGGGTLAISTVATDAQGHAQTTWTLGTPGANTVEVHADGLAGSPVVFSAGATGFASKVDYATGCASCAGGPGGAAFVATDDLNGDGKPDIVVPNLIGGYVPSGSPEGTISALLDTTATAATSASFTANVDVPTGSSMYTGAVALADLNGDGKLDVVTANGFSSVSVLLNTTTTGATTASFATGVAVPTGTYAGVVAVADINGDGMPDLVVATGSNTVSVLLNATAVGAMSPSFAVPVDFSVGSTASPDVPTFIATADVNADGMPDLVVVNGNADTVGVLLNTTEKNGSTPSFGSNVEFAIGPWISSVAIGDFNGDGKLDLAVANNQADGPEQPLPVGQLYYGDVSVLLNTTETGAAAPSFAASVDFHTDLGGGASSVVVGDFNGDGKADLAVTNLSTNTVSVLINTVNTGSMTSSFAPSVDFATGTRPSCVVSADVNGDGTPDLVVANSYDANVSVLLAQ